MPDPNDERPNYRADLDRARHEAAAFHEMGLTQSPDVDPDDVPFRTDAEADAFMRKLLGG